MERNFLNNHEFVLDDLELPLTFKQELALKAQVTRACSGCSKTVKEANLYIYLLTHRTSKNFDIICDYVKKHDEKLFNSVYVYLATNTPIYPIFSKFYIGSILDYLDENEEEIVASKVCVLIEDFTLLNYRTALKFIDDLINTEELEFMQDILQMYKLNIKSREVELEKQRYDYVVNTLGGDVDYEVADESLEKEELSYTLVNLEFRGIPLMGDKYSEQQIDEQQIDEQQIDEQQTDEQQIDEQQIDEQQKRIFTPKIIKDKNSVNAKYSLCRYKKVDKSHWQKVSELSFPTKEDCFMYRENLFTNYPELFEEYRFEIEESK